LLHPDNLAVHVHKLVNNIMAQHGMVDPAIFESLQEKVDQESATREVYTDTQKNASLNLLTWHTGAARNCADAREAR